MRTKMNAVALKLGAAAFANGQKRIPCHDPFLAAVGFTLPNLVSWLRGWDEANLAAPY